MKKSTIVLIFISIACLSFYIFISGTSWKSFWVLLLANGFGVTFFALLITTVGRRMANKAIENIDKRIEDHRR